MKLRALILFALCFALLFTGCIRVTIDIGPEKATPETTPADSPQTVPGKVDPDTSAAATEDVSAEPAPALTEPEPVDVDPETLKGRWVCEIPYQYMIQGQDVVYNPVLDDFTYEVYLIFLDTEVFELSLNLGSESSLLESSMYSYLCELQDIDRREFDELYGDSATNTIHKALQGLVFPEISRCIMGNYSVKNGEFSFQSFSLEDRDNIFIYNTSLQSTLLKTQNNQQRKYKYNTFRDYGFLDIVTYDSFVREKYETLYGSGFSENQDYLLDIDAINDKNSYMDNPSVMEFYEKYQQQGYEIDYLGKVKNGRRLAVGGNPYLLAIRYLDPSENEPLRGVYTGDEIILYLDSWILHFTRYQYIYE